MRFKSERPRDQEVDRRPDGFAEDEPGLNDRGAIPAPRGWGEPTYGTADAAYIPSDPNQRKVGARLELRINEQGALAPWDDSISDGCTMAVDWTWRQACVAHDQKYYYGGTEEDRLRADHELVRDMIAQGAPEWIAWLYFYAVRIGGVPGSGLPWRWGFGEDLQKK
jgi:hypothetical protein